MRESGDRLFVRRNQPSSKSLSSTSFLVHRSSIVTTRQNENTPEILKSRTNTKKLKDTAQESPNQMNNSSMLRSNQSFNNPRAAIEAIRQVANRQYKADASLSKSHHEDKQLK